jgi:hypothetical protein
LVQHLLAVATGCERSELLSVGARYAEFARVDRSWLRLDRSRNEVTQGGPRLMWDEIEDLFETWCRLGAPNREHFGLTVTMDGRHTLWLDSPDSGQTWDVAR